MGAARARGGTSGPQGGVAAGYSFSGAQSRLHGGADEYDAPWAELRPGGWAEDDGDPFGDDWDGYGDGAAMAAAARSALA